MGGGGCCSVAHSASIEQDEGWKRKTFFKFIRQEGLDSFVRVKGSAQSFKLKQLSYDKMALIHFWSFSQG